ncbi:hypothetical protein [Priestia aryabhattai]
MKKIIVTVTTLLAVLIVPAFLLDTKGETSNSATANEPFFELIEQNKDIQQDKSFSLYKKITYKNSPFYDHVKYYIPDENPKHNQANEDKTKTTIELSDYKLLDVRDSTAIANVTEEATYKTKTTETDVEMSYYYVFKKKNEKWFIYDQVAATGNESSKKLLEKYS